MNEPKITEQLTPSPTVDARHFFDACGTMIAGENAAAIHVSKAKIVYENIITGRSFVKNIKYKNGAKRVSSPNSRELTYFQSQIIMSWPHKNLKKSQKKLDRVLV